MMQQIIKPLRIFFAVIAPILFIASAAAKYYWPESNWAPVAFAMLLASIVGFYTNFIAIKMLFRPSKPTILGVRGSFQENNLNWHDDWGKVLMSTFLMPRR